MRVVTSLFALASLAGNSTQEVQPMQISLASLSEHSIADVGFYLCFLAGQVLFMLKRAASAIRNPSNPVKTRRGFFFVNWDVLSIRAAFETLFIYYPWRHLGIAMILSLFNVDVSSGWIHALIGTGIGGGPIAAVAIGYAADSVLDGASQKPGVPAWVKRWLAENIPAAPAQAPPSDKPTTD